MGTMKHSGQHHQRTRAVAGFTLVECLIGLAISAVLMVALAVVFNASITNFKENEELFESVNNARQALARMTTELRTADGVWSAAPSNQCVFYGAADPNTLLTFEYRDATDATDPNTLVLIKDGTAYTLCDNVTAASFTKTPADANAVDSKSVLISMTVKTGDRERTLAAAAVVRRALTY
jgi:prepilin-type N-terminal cleavage/methylation domain-containing protein